MSWLCEPKYDDYITIINVKTLEFLLIPFYIGGLSTKNCFLSDCVTTNYLVPLPNDRYGVCKTGRWRSEIWVFILTITKIFQNFPKIGNKKLVFCMIHWPLAGFIFKVLCIIFAGGKGLKKGFVWKYTDCPLLFQW